MEQRKLQEMRSDLQPENFVKSPQRKALIERWSKWIPAKVTNPYQKYCLAQLFENQLSELKGFREKHILGEDTTVGNCVTVEPGVFIGSSCRIGSLKNIARNVPDNASVV